jgi:lactoylglutathione lyase
MFKLHHVALEVVDLIISADFYQTLLHLTEERRLSILGEEILFLVHEDFRLELIEKANSGKNFDRTHLCFQIDSISDILLRLNDLEISLLEGPHYLDNGWKSVFAKGPDGEILEFLEID